MLQCVALISATSLISCKKDKKDDKPSTPANHFTYAGNTFTLDKGYMQSYQTWAVNPNFDVYLVSPNIQWNPSQSQFFGVGDFLYFEMFSSTPDGLITGRYNYSASSDVFTFKTAWVGMNTSAASGTWVTIVGGHIDLVVSGNEYSFTFSFTLLDQQTVTGSYKGTLSFM